MLPKSPKTPISAFDHNLEEGSGSGENLYNGRGEGKNGGGGRDEVGGGRGEVCCKC